MVQFNEGSNPLRLEPTNRSDCLAFEPSEDAEVTLPPSTDLTFRYAVQNGDMALPHLSLASRDAKKSHLASIHLNGSSILRHATFPTTKANKGTLYCQYNGNRRSQLIFAVDK